LIYFYLFIAYCLSVFRAEPYIHRAGRTARAGKTGTCVTVYTPSQASEVQSIANEAKIRIHR